MNPNGKEIFRFLEGLFKNFERKPFLFIGSGISRRYIDLPNWESMLIAASKRTSDNEFYYLGIINGIKSFYPEIEDCDLYPKVATQIEVDFNKKFYSDKLFEKELKDKYLTFVKMGVSPFKILISDLNSTFKYTYAYKKEIEMFKKIKPFVSGVITTNYDTFVESIFSDFDVFISQVELLNAILYHDSEIYKIHGSVTDPSSIVINEYDYKLKKDKEKYLSSKLLTLFLEYPIIFLGYSANDSNIKSIFFDLDICLNSEQRQNLYNRMLFVEYVDSTIKQEFGIKTISNISIHSISLNLYNILYASLSQNIKAGMPVKLIKRAKQMIATLIENDSNNQHSKLKTSNLDELSNDNQLAIHIAGSDSIFETGYRSITLDQIQQEVIFNIYDYDPKLIINNFAEINKSRYSRSYLPLHKFFSKFEGEATEFTKDRILSDINSLFSSAQLKKFNSAKKYNQISEIQALKFPIRNEISAILMSIDKFSVEDILVYLTKTYFEYYPNLKEGNKTDYKKIIVVYDFLKFR
ncbi:MAG: hypothetical protein CVV56_01215 [Tenericutes bacterium HGW-Tenericutes-1]|jgi:hypothetical protein|nr:MAG: hypothetical protein CVV56_01215 [Tenericutes bacterium HGW-Tenericutes-1]